MVAFLPFKPTTSKIRSQSGSMQLAHCSHVTQRRNITRIKPGQRWGAFGVGVGGVGFVIKCVTIVDEVPLRFWREQQQILQDFWERQSDILSSLIPVHRDWHSSLIVVPGWLQVRAREIGSIHSPGCLKRHIRQKHITSTSTVLPHVIKRCQFILYTVDQVL